MIIHVVYTVDYLPIFVYYFINDYYDSYGLNF